MAQILDYLTKNFGKGSSLSPSVGNAQGASTVEKTASPEPEANKPSARSAAGKNDESNQLEQGRLPFSATVRNVTAEDLLKPLEDDWRPTTVITPVNLTVLLSQVDRKTVKNLSMAWSTKFCQARCQHL